MLGNAQGMVLHPRASSNITHNEDLNMFIFWLLSGMIAGRDGVERPLPKPNGERKYVAKSNDGQPAEDGGYYEISVVGHLGRTESCLAARLKEEEEMMYSWALFSRFGAAICEA